MTVFHCGDIYSDAAVAVIGGNKTVARRTLNILARKSLIDQDSDSKIFSLHPLIQSFAFEKAENEFKEAAFRSFNRFSKYYLFIFEELNEQYLTGSSLSAYLAFIQEKENIARGLCLSLNYEELRDKTFDVLAKAELFLHFLNDAKIYDHMHVYQRAIEIAKKLKNESAYCKLVVSEFFQAIFLRGVRLIPVDVKERIALMRD